MAHATMMAASALASGQLGSHLSRPHATNDSRLLLNLIKSERTYISHLHASVTSAHAAASALSAWGTSEAPDVTETSLKLASLLAACSDVQNTHVQAIEGYRAALKDVADREASIRNVVRDRDILVGRLIKTSNKSANLSGKSKKSPEERAEKVAMAQRELHSCEEVLAQEELALVGVKRRTFKEALTMRMKTMGDAGAAMVEAAQEAILLLDAFDSSAYQGAQSPAFNEYASNSVDQGWDAYQQQQQQQHYNQQQYEQQQYDQSLQYDSHQQYGQQQHYDAQPHQYDQHNVDGAVDARNIPLNNQFEVSSVTPSQSASQIYQPQYQSRHSNAYAAPYHVTSDNGLQSQHHQQSVQNQNKIRQQEADSDSDEEDWRRSFNPAQNTAIHSGGNGTQLPAPHQLSANAGTHRTFMPYAAAIETTPGPTPPAKDTNKQLESPVNGSKPVKTKKKKSSSLAKERNEQFGPPNTVAMPPIPTAPRLNPDGVHVGDIPTAPKLYMPGASGDQDDSSSDEDVAIPIASSMRQGWSSRQVADEASSDGGQTAKQSSRPEGVKRSNSFFGKMGRLFKTDVKGEGDAKGQKADRTRRDSYNSSSTWNTRTDALVKENRKYASKDLSSNLSRRQGALSKPTARQEANSSDEEPIDERNLIRVKNPKRPMWQAPKANSDLGSKKNLTDDLKRPESIRQSSSASVTVGPASYKASQQDKEAALNRSNTTTAPAIKKKKKKSNTDGAERRAASLDGDSQRAGVATARNSIIVSGDASSGVRRSDSLDYGSHDTIKKKKKSKRISTASTPSLYGETKSGAINAMEGQGKFTTNNWVAKPGSVKDDPAFPPPNIYVPTAPAPANFASTTTSTPSNSVPTASAPNIYVPSAPAPTRVPIQPITTASPSPSKMRMSQTAESLEEVPVATVAPKHVPQPSATMSPPIKPALKLPGSTELIRSGSVTSSMGNIPSLPPPMSAPPPVTSMTLPSDSDFVSKQVRQPDQKQGVAAEERDGPVDSSTKGTASQVESTALPKVDIPSIKPLKVELDAKVHGQEGAESMSKATESDQPTGVSRITDRIASVGRGVLGWRGTSPPKNSTEAASTAPAGKLSRSYSDQVVALSSDSSEDEGLPAQKKLTGMAPAPSTNDAPIAQQASGAAAAAAPALTNTVPTIAPINTSIHPPAPASSVDGGSNIGRRKSVRMAPDVKLPPETPTDVVGSKEAGFDFRSPSSQLSSRIAPPPQAPPRINLQQDRPIDIGSSSRDVQGWSIRTTPMDDSSDDDDIDEYNQARKAFGSVSKGWSKSSKSSTSKAKKSSASAETASLGGGPKLKKKKKRESSSNLGYNPSVPLPPGIEVVGSSRRSIR